MMMSDWIAGRIGKDLAHLAYGGMAMFGAMAIMGLVGITWLADGYLRDFAGAIFVIGLVFFLAIAFLLIKEIALGE